MFISQKVGGTPSPRMNFDYYLLAYLLACPLIASCPLISSKLLLTGFSRTGVLEKSY
ncbi:MAG: hypothetical protein GY950_35675 [bacterium]|nr:hypothetical protein [bacterium]